MFADGYFSLSFEGLLGLIVTVVGIWLVVRQLMEPEREHCGAQERGRGCPIPKSFNQREVKI